MIKIKLNKKIKFFSYFMKVIFFNQLPIDIITTINQFIPKKNCDYCSKNIIAYYNYNIYCSNQCYFLNSIIHFFFINYFYCKFFIFNAFYFIFSNFLNITMFVFYFPIIVLNFLLLSFYLLLGLLITPFVLLLVLTIKKTHYFLEGVY